MRRFGPIAVLVLAVGGVVSGPASAVTVPAIASAAGLYYPVTPARILDTRSGVGASQAKVPGGSTVHLQVDGRGGLPPDGVAAVVVNVTVTHPTTGGHVTAFAGGTARPLASTINYAKGWTGANLATVPVGADGSIDLYNSAGSIDLIADVEGWYASSDTVDPAFGVGRAFNFEDSDDRALDTRFSHQPLGAHQFRDVQIALHAEDPNLIHAIALTLTATNVTAGGYLSVGYPGSNLTATSTLNLKAGTTTNNSAIAQAQPCVTCDSGDSEISYATIRLYNGSSHAVDVLVDLQGYYTDQDQSPLRFQTRTPTRVVDTRTNLGADTFAAASNRTILASVPLISSQTQVLVANVTAVDPTSHTYITLWPNLTNPRPTASTLNAAPGAVVAIGALILVGHPNDHQVQFGAYNAKGRTDLLIDVTGVFDTAP